MQENPAPYLFRNEQTESDRASNLETLKGDDIVKRNPLIDPSKASPAKSNGCLTAYISRKIPIVGSVYQPDIGISIKTTAHTRSAVLKSRHRWGKGRRCDQGYRGRCLVALTIGTLHGCKFLLAVWLLYTAFFPRAVI